MYTCIPLRLRHRNTIKYPLLFYSCVSVLQFPMMQEVFEFHFSVFSNCFFKALLCSSHSICSHNTFQPSLKFFMYRCKKLQFCSFCLHSLVTSRKTAFWEFPLFTRYLLYEKSVSQCYSLANKWKQSKSTRFVASKVKFSKTISTFF